MINPDLGDYGTYGTSRHPDLWEGCIFSSTPALGVTGAVLPDFSQSGLDLGTTGPVWNVEKGIMGVKSGSYSNKNLIVSPYPVITVAMSLYSKSVDSSAIYIETSVNLNANVGSFYVVLQSNYLTFATKVAGGYHIESILLSTVGIGSIDRIINLCCVWKTKVALGELAISLLIVNGVDYTSQLGFQFGGGAHNLATNGFNNFPIFIGARNKTSLPMSGPCFDVAIYNRSFSASEATRYTNNPLERYQRRRRFCPVSRRFNPAIARNSNIMIPGIATC